MSTRHSEAARRGRLSTAQQIRLVDFLREKMSEIQRGKWTQGNLALLATERLGFEVSTHTLGRTARALDISWPGGNPNTAHGKRRSRLTAAEKRIANLEKALMFLISKSPLHQRDYTTIENLIHPRQETFSHD